MVCILGAALCLSKCHPSVQLDIGQRARQHVGQVGPPELCLRAACLVGTSPRLGAGRYEAHGRIKLLTYLWIGEFITASPSKGHRELESWRGMQGSSQCQGLRCCWRGRLSAWEEIGEAPVLVEQAAVEVVVHAREAWEM